MSVHLSIIIPSYNSALVLKNNVPYLIEFLKSKDYSHEIIIVDDGSLDEGHTKRAAEELGCKYVRSEKNGGKGEAVRKGMLQAQGKFRIFTDADIPFESQAIDVFLHYLDQKEFDLVVGDRTLVQSNYYGEISRGRKIGSSWFSFVVGRFVAGGMFDTQCGMKGFKAKIAEDIFGVGKIKGFAFDVEVIYIALKRNYDIKRLPVNLRSQEGSSVNMLKHSIPMVLDLFKIKWNHINKKYEKGN